MGTTPRGQSRYIPWMVGGPWSTISRWFWQQSRCIFCSLFFLGNSLVPDDRCSNGKYSPLCRVVELSLTIALRVFERVLSQWSLYRCVLSYGYVLCGGRTRGLHIFKYLTMYWTLSLKRSRRLKIKLRIRTATNKGHWSCSFPLLTTTAAPNQISKVRSGSYATPSHCMKLSEKSIWLGQMVT